MDNLRNTLGNLPGKSILILHVLSMLLIGSAYGAGEIRGNFPVIVIFPVMARRLRESLYELLPG